MHVLSYCLAFVRRERDLDFFLWKISADGHIHFRLHKRDAPVHVHGTVGRYKSFDLQAGRS